MATEMTGNAAVAYMTEEIDRLRQRIAELERALNGESESARMLQDRIARLLPNARLGAAVRAMPEFTYLYHIPGGAWEHGTPASKERALTPEAALGIKEADDA